MPERDGMTAPQPVTARSAALNHTADADVSVTSAPAEPPLLSGK